MLPHSNCHIGFRNANVLGRNVFTAQCIHRIGESGEHFGRLGLVLVGQDYCLATAHGQTGHRVLVTHTARQAQRIAHGVGRIGIVPETRAAGTRPEVSGMERDDRCQTAFRVTYNLYEFVVVEIRFGPECRHAPYAPREVLWTADSGRKWGDRRGSNPRPPVPQTGALTN